MRENIPYLNRSHLIKQVDSFRKILKVRLPADTWSTQTWDEIVDRYNYDLDKWYGEEFNEKANQNGPDIYKQAALLCFWIRKLKPIPVVIKNHQYYNETCALIVAFQMITEIKGAVKFQGNPQDFFEDLTFNLRYRPSSPYMVAQVLKAFWRNK